MVEISKDALETTVVTLAALLARRNGPLVQLTPTAIVEVGIPNGTLDPDHRLWIISVGPGGLLPTGKPELQPGEYWFVGNTVPGNTGLAPLLQTGQELSMLRLRQENPPSAKMADLAAAVIDASTGVCVRINHLNPKTDNWVNVGPPLTADDIVLGVADSDGKPMSGLPCVIIRPSTIAGSLNELTRVVWVTQDSGIEEYKGAQYDLTVIAPNNGPGDQDQAWFRWPNDEP